MGREARDSYLKNSPDSRNFSRRIARIRQKGFHAESRPGEGNELDASAVYLVNPGSNPIVGARPWGDGTPVWVRDATTNDSDKTILTVPTGKLDKPIALFATLVTTATVGNRIVGVEIGDGTNVVWQSTYTGAIAAGKVGGIHIAFGQGVPTSSSVRYGLTNAFEDVGANDYGPDLILLAGYTVRVYDKAAIDPAADDLTVVLHYVEYDA